MSRVGAAGTTSVIRKELRAYGDGAAVYIVTIIFLLLWEFLFFRSAFLAGEASLRGLFGYLPWMMLLLVPAITMGSISQERSEGTLELLLTHPLKDRDLLVGKYLAALGLTAAVLAFAVPVGASFDRFGTMDWGVIAGQYLAAVCMAAVLIAVGVLVSSVVASQMAALLVTAAACFFLVTAGLDLVTARMPMSVAAIVAQLGVMTHFDSMARGVIDLRDLWYFASMVVSFLALAYLQLLRRRFGNRTGLYRSYQVGVALVIGIAVLTNVVGARIPGRIDLTQERRYTLSDATHDTVRDLDDVVTVTLYASSELPAQLQPVLRDVRDMLRDYRTLGQGNVVVRFKDTSAKKKIAEEATSKGVQEVQFNVVGDEEFKLKKGFMGIVVSHAGTSETIPFVGDTSDLEYQLTSIVRQLTTKEKKKVGFLTGHGEKDSSQGMTVLSKELGRQFEVTLATVDPKTGKLPDDLGVLVVAGPSKKVKEPERDAIRSYLDGGGSALMLLEGVTVDQQSASAQANKESLSDLIADYGVSVGQNLVYDLQSNITATFGGAGGMSFMLPYPSWPRVVPAGSHPSTKGLESVALLWASSVSIEDSKVEKAGLKVSDLLVTSRYAGLQAGPYEINPQRQLPQEGLGEHVVAASVMAAKGAKGKKPRMVVVGDSDFIGDDFVQRAPENLAFGMQAISWLSQEPSLASIQVKGKALHKLSFDDESDQGLVKWGNMLLAALVPAGIGAWRLWRRRRLSRLTYETRPQKMRERGKVAA